MKKISKFFLFTAFSLLLSACETEQSFEAPEAYGPLKLLGSIGRTFYVGTRFDVEFGVTGGQAPYRYRYLKEPPEGFDAPQAENTLDFNILAGNGAKPSFRLQGIILPSAEGGDGSSVERSAFYIEVTDGVNTIVEEFVYNLVVPNVSLQSTTISEQRSNLGIFDSALRNIASGGDLFYCNNVKESGYPSVSEIDGRPVRPVAIGVNLQRPIVETVSLSYRVTSNYSEGDLETSLGNLGIARPGVDFVESEGVLVFEPGASRCLVVVQLFDDDVIEGDEDFKIEIFDREGGLLDLVSVEQSFFTITDDEPTVTVDPVSRVINVSQSGTVPLRLSAAGAQKYINFGVEGSLTNAEASTFELVPMNGVAVFPEGERDSFMGVKVTSATSNKLGPDRKIALYSATDFISDEELSTFVINEWPRDGIPENERLILEENDLKALALAGDTSGRVYVLKHAVDPLGFSYGVVSAMYRDGSTYRLTEDANDIVIRAVGKNVTPKDIVFSEDGSLLIVVSEVDGAFNSQHRGLVDTLVTSYAYDEDGFMSLSYDAQYGTELDDFVNGVSLNGFNLYVYGSSRGLEFDGEPGAQSNSGEEDGFIYSLSINDGAKQWATFLGDDQSNAVLALASGRLEVYPLVSDGPEGRRAFVSLLDQNGEQDMGVENFLIRPFSPHYFRSSIVNGSANTFTILSDGLSSPTTGAITASRTHDVFISSYGTALETGSSLALSTSGIEKAASQSYLLDKELLGVAGSTSGEFDDNISAGGDDAFFAIISTEDGARLNKVTQFGTPGNDQAIDSISVGDSKFLVLWQEDFSSGDASLSYRISAFSFDGTKLSPDL